MVYGEILTDVSHVLSSMGDKSYFSFAFSGIGSLIMATEIATVSSISLGTLLNASALFVSVAGIVYGIAKNVFDALDLGDSDLNTLFASTITVVTSVFISPFLMQKMGVVTLAEEGMSALLASFLGGTGVAFIAISIAMLAVPFFLMLQETHVRRAREQRG